MTSSKKSSRGLRFRDNAWLPAPRLLLLLLIGILFSGWGVAVGYDLLFFALYNGALLVLILIEVRFLRFTSAIHVERNSKPFLEIAIDNKVQLVITNPLRVPLHGELRDDYPEGFQVDQRTFRFTVPPQQKESVRYFCRPHRRGEHRFGKIHLRIYGYLGLLIRQRAVEAEETKRVYPKLTEIRRIRGGIYRKALGLDGPHSLQGLGRGWEFSHLREYIPDDEPRLINWTVTARRGHLVTNVYQPEQGQQIAILIDCGRIMGIHQDGQTKLDRALEAALVFAAMAIERGDQVSLIACSNRIKSMVPLGKGEGHLQRIIEATYNLEPNFVETDYRTAIESLILRNKRRSLVAVFTDGSNLTFADELVKYMKILQRRHLVMTVTMQDHRLESDARKWPINEEDVFHKAIAQQLTQEREEKLYSLRRRGIIVLDVPPDQLATAVIHKYIEIKNRALL